MKKIFLLLTLSLMLFSCSNYSEGDRVGVITKFSHSGQAFKSYEGELKVAPNVANSGMVGQYETFRFSLDNDESISCVTPVDSIKYYAKQGIPVVITYQQTMHLNWFNNRGDTDYFVKSVIPVK